MTPNGIVANEVDRDIDFKLQSFYNIHFRTNTLWKIMTYLVPTGMPTGMSYLVALQFFYKVGFDIK